jgi:hypothetical protein
MHQSLLLSTISVCGSCVLEKALHLHTIVHATSLPIMFWQCPTLPLDKLISGNNSTSSFTDWMDNVHPTDGYLYFNVAQKRKYGAFKSMLEGRINLIGTCPFPTVAGAALVALKQPYMDNPGITDADSSAIPATLALSPDDQAQDLSADALSTQWANSLLRDVYDFIREYTKHANTECPEDIPQFRFVAAGLAITTFPSEKKEVFLVEELIQQEEDGPWRKYINNNSSRPCNFSDSKNKLRAEFLSFCQHVQYWRTRCLAFTSDFQGLSFFPGCWHDD